MNSEFIDDKLKSIIDKKIASMKSKYITVGTGITSSHLGDERNLREFIIADEVVKYLRTKGFNVNFLLVDDSFDPLNFRQLRVAVNKDEKLIKKFEKYCGTPIKLIPDPYECHDNFSQHYQNEILSRFRSLDIYPSIIDTYSTYNTGLYNYAKEIVFTKRDEIRQFLKKKFPNYEMKNIFWALCPKCQKLDSTSLKRINDGKATIECSSCKSKTRLPWMEIQGKFGWKLDTAVKWNVFKFDFEPFSKAYLDPDVGSYIIAKSLSEEFFGGNYPEIIEYGQVLMDRSLSYSLLPALPVDIFRALFLEQRKRDITLTEAKVLQITRKYKVDGMNSYLDYVNIKLPYELLENLSNSNHKSLTLLQYGSVFAKKFLQKEVFPQLPDDKYIKSIKREDAKKIISLYKWIIDFRIKHPGKSYEEFVENINKFLKKNGISRGHLFPIIRELLLQEEGIPLTRIFYYLPLHSHYASLFIIEKELRRK